MRADAAELVHARVGTEDSVVADRHVAGDLRTGVQTLKDATPIADVVKSPKDFVGKTIRVDGVATAVCEAMGCWMAFIVVPLSSCLIRVG